MNNLTHTKLGVAAAMSVALVAAGGAYAANSQHGSSQHGSAATVTTSKAGPPQCHGGPGPGRGPADELAAAASYLGLTQAQLQAAHQAGKTLAQVADSTTGKSSAGLIAALVAHEQDELAQAVEAGKLTQAQADAMKGDLTARVTGLVNGVRPTRPPGPPGPGI
jgi:hypothetical protein